MTQYAMQGLVRLRDRMQQRGMDAALWIVHGGELESTARGVPALPWRRIVDWHPVEGA